MKLMRSLILAALCVWCVPLTRADESKWLVTSSSSGATHVNPMAGTLQFRELA
jgi:hypothetical protein